MHGTQFSSADHHKVMHDCTTVVPTVWAQGGWRKAERGRAQTTTVPLISNLAAKLSPVQAAENNVSEKVTHRIVGVARDEARGEK